MYSLCSNAAMMQRMVSALEPQRSTRQLSQLAWRRSLAMTSLVEAVGDSCCYRKCDKICTETPPIAAFRAHKPQGGRSSNPGGGRVRRRQAAGSGGEKGALVGGHGPLVEDDLPVARPHQADGLPRSARPYQCEPLVPACKHFTVTVRSEEGTA